MDKDTKDLLRALVDNTGCSVGGLEPAEFDEEQVFLLKGPPGTGRMTTVHAVCDLLKGPLLSITITADDFLYDLVNLLSDIALRVSAVVPAFFSIGISRERRLAVQAMHLSNGLPDPIGLWIGHLLWDSILLSVTLATK
ncbi:hypothetical protein CY34DRAFT_18273 [Suillus luteus UH-Slu-Lm8-n1]|uniref:Uncharacterized protein n=1 Tax=Suillus luteus UH-Slu-Lm8-n1 TaxID=930992 RepID=A0A0C9Z7U6_9AGAM|nr:hypothetical protein CY34DRAFT_18273 [Suillus luteus UH-Slu-Lm8-n1]